ncbi:MAG TPA: hypothetical protein VF720_03520 [Candidatus Eisenbacteria bacterium]
MTDYRPPDPKPANLWILQSAFLVGLVTYSGFGAVSLMGRGGDSTGIFADPDVNTFVGTGLLLVAILIIILATVLPRLMPALDPDRAATADDYLDRAFKQLVFTNALLEAPALLALIAVLLGRSLLLFPLVVIVLSGVAMVAMMPKIRGWIDEYGRRVERERSGSR